jgi:Xaa-Pro aminopeptidase
VKNSQRTALAVTGIKNSALQDFEKVLFEMMTHAETIYINTNEHYRAAVETETREALCKMVEDKYPAHTVAKKPILRIRSVKKRIRSYTTHVPLPKRIQKSSVFRKTNVMEYEIEAEFIHEFTQSLKGFPTHNYWFRKQC